MIITRVAMFLDRSWFVFFIDLYWFYFIGYILFRVLWDIAHAVILQLLACKEPPCDGVEAQ